MKIKTITAAALALAVLAGAAGCGKASEATKKAMEKETSASAAAATQTAAKKTPAPESAAKSTPGAQTKYTEFSKRCMRNLDYIGENLKNRDLTEKGEKKKTDHDRARDWIVSEILKAGYSKDAVELMPFTAKGDFGVGTYEGKNIILTVKGSDTSKQIIVGAHYDGDGVSDNGSGTALLLGAVQELAGRTPDYTVKYIFFDGEEAGELGSDAYAKAMSDSEIKRTACMVNIDAIGFGDYCNIYGGVQDDDKRTVEKTGAYELAVKKARELGIKVYTTRDLDGYYKKHGKGPEKEANALFTNPWTYENPAPENADKVSPTTVDASDHVPFADRGIEYVYMEATNWYVKKGLPDSFTGYFDTDNSKIGADGMFMNTKYDTLKNLEKYYPGRAEEHFRTYSRLLASLIMAPKQK